MIIVIDALNRHKFPHVLDDMFRLRARVFHGRLGWDVSVDAQGREIDVFDGLDPAYLVGLDNNGSVISCVRALQTTGPHMLSDVFSPILCGAPPLRDPQVIEATRFCVDTARLGRARGSHSVSRATRELLIAACEFAVDGGARDAIAVVDPLMERILIRSGYVPYGYLGKPQSFGKAIALAALLECSDESIATLRRDAGIDDPVRLTDDEALVLTARAARTTDKTAREQTCPAKNPIHAYCMDQIADAKSDQDQADALRLYDALIQPDWANPAA